MMQHGMTSVPSLRWFWIWSGVWPAIRQRLTNWEQDTVLQVTVQGHGLQHATHTQVNFGTETLTSTVAQHPDAAKRPGALTWLGRTGRSCAELAIVAMLLEAKPAMQMTLQVSVPARLMHRLQQQMAEVGNAGLEVTVQSDFCSSTVPVSVQSTKALQDKLNWASLLALCHWQSKK